MNQNYRYAVAHWREQLGEAKVIDDSAALDTLLENTSGLPRPDVNVCLKAASAADVRIALGVAAEYKIPLYPYSSGKNWGLGSKLPPSGACALLDLSGLNQIREVNTELHYAVIEAGVTQQQLSDYLAERNLPLMLNLTGSSPNTSVLANTLERGTGFHRQRTADCKALEVLLADGTQLRTGFWADKPEAMPHFYQHGIGPALDGIFAQSNFGIATAMVVDLIPRPQRITLMAFSFEDAALAGVLDKVRSLFDQGLLRWIVHMFNDTRMNTMTDSKNPPWMALSAVMGDADQVAFLSAQLRAKLGPLGTALHFLEEEQVDAEGADPMLKVMFDVHRGKPTWGFLHGLYHTIAKQVPDDYDALDQTSFGMVACLPVLPMLGAQVVAARELIQRVCLRHGLEPAITFNPIDATALETVVNLYFDRQEPAAVAGARACLAELHAVLHASGLRFYRTDIGNMAYLAGNGSSQSEVVNRIGRALDPLGLIAPGRYRSAGG